MEIHSDYSMKTKMVIFKSVHFVLTIVLFCWAWFPFRYKGVPQVNDVGYRYNYLAIALFAVLFAFFNRTYNSYLFGYMRVRTLVFQQYLSQLFPVLIIYFAVCIAWSHWDEPQAFLFLLAGYIPLDMAGSYLGNKLYFKLNPPRRTLLIYHNSRDRRRFGAG